MERRELPLPEFYDPANAADWAYEPAAERLIEQAARWRRRHRLKPVSDDHLDVRLLIIDGQRDFCFPEGSLFVGGRSGRGAIDDNDRLCRFIYRHLSLLGEITCTLDTHLPHQIFFASFWLGETGEPAQANRTVTLADLDSGDLRPDPALAARFGDGSYGWLERQVRDYCANLEASGRYQLFLWPPHCLLGSRGQTLAGVIQEARLFHSFARAATGRLEIKGTAPLTEYYSALAPEVSTAHDGSPLASTNTRLVDELLAADRLIVAGQAASHCVKATMEDLLTAARERGPRTTEKIYLLEDCCSAVTVPGPAEGDAPLFDFTDDAEAAFERLAEGGIRRIRSTDPPAAWPGFSSS